MNYLGYGDRYPVSNTGRLVGMFVMMLGVGLFGVLTGFLANAFLPEKSDEGSTATSQMDDPQTQIARFRQLLEEQERVNSVLRAQLSTIEKQLEMNASQKNS